MIYINITNFVFISKLEKDQSMIETHRLKNNVIFIQIIQVYANNVGFTLKMRLFLI